ncbi:unnamed protein product, partial [Iphiclides podalirius]
MFDEHYPDPVRVVSVGIPVEELEKNPDGPSGYETSVEFCGGSHLHQTGHIGDYVIVSEEGIAKGIRRIVALTGPEAIKALNKLSILENEVNTIANFIKEKGDEINQKDVVKKIVDLTNEVSHAQISYWKKEELRNTLKGFKKQLDDKERASKAMIVTQVIEKTKEICLEEKSSDVIVTELKASGNTKALDSALKQVKQLLPNTAAMFFSVDEEAGKIYCLAAVPKNLNDKGLLASEWVQSIVGIMGGKGGGKAESAQASGNNPKCIKEAIHKAKEFALSKL